MLDTVHAEFFDDHRNGIGQEQVIRIAVVTIVAGRHDHLRAQRRGLSRCARRLDQHVVVAMGDADIEAVVDDDLGLTTSVVHVPVPPAGLPLAAARNAGAAAAIDVDLLVFLDVDCIPDESLLGRYEQAALQRPDAVLCGPVTYLPPRGVEGWTQAQLTDARAPHPARPDPGTGELVPAEPALFWSLSFAMTSAAWRRSGGFYEGYVGYGGEDTDFARCADRIGMPILWVGGADVYHQHHADSAGPALHVDDIIRNGSVFASRHGTWPMEGWLRQLAATGLVRAEDQGWRRVDVVRVATIPETHEYVEAVRPWSVLPSLLNRSARWRPDPIWDEEWLAPRLQHVDVVHVHFGFDELTDEEIDQWLALLARHGKALVVTVHDLRSPHEAVSGPHESRLKRFVQAAAQVFTLTEGAAAECRRLFGCEAEVIPHPTVQRGGRPMDLADPGPPAVARRSVLLPLKALRANIVNPAGFVSAVREAAAGARVDVLLHPTDHRSDDVERVLQVAAAGGVNLDIRPYLTDVELHEIVGQAHTVVLPYAFGTHSGWVELCRDLGARVVAPDCGYFAEQWSEVFTYRAGDLTSERSGLRTTVRRALREPRPHPADRTARLASRDVVRATHDLRYRQLAEHSTAS